MPVRAKGRSQGSESGKSPKPLPKSKVGDNVVKPGAPAANFPVFPQVTSSAARAIASCSALMNNWYCVPVVRPWNPVCVRTPGVRIWAQSVLRVKSQLGVINIDRSLPMSNSREPSLASGRGSPSAATSRRRQTGRRSGSWPGKSGRRQSREQERCSPTQPSAQPRAQTAIEHGCMKEP